MRPPRYGWIGYGPRRREGGELRQMMYIRKWHPGYWLFCAGILLRFLAGRV